MNDIDLEDMWPVKFQFKENGYTYRGGYFVQFVLSHLSVGSTPCRVELFSKEALFTGVCFLYKLPQN